MIKTKEEFEQELSKLNELLLDDIVLLENTYILADCSDSIVNDPEMVFKAIQQNSKNIDYIGDCLKDDESFFLSLLSANPEFNIFSLVRNASDRLKDNKQFADECIKSDGSIIEEFSFAVRNDPDIVLEAAKNNIMSLHYVSSFDNELVLFYELLEHHMKQSKNFLNMDMFVKVIFDGLSMIPAGKTLLQHFKENANTSIFFKDASVFFKIKPFIYELTKEEFLDTITLSKKGEEINNLIKKVNSKKELAEQEKANTILLTKLKEQPNPLKTECLFKRNLSLLFISYQHLPKRG